MITQPEYKVMGEDGHDYGPVSAEQIRKWVVEQRLDRKSPILPPDSKDWVFLESLPEFNDLFHPSPSPAAPPVKPKMAAGIGFSLDYRRGRCSAEEILPPLNHV